MNVSPQIVLEKSPWDRFHDVQRELQDCRDRYKLLLESRKYIQGECLSILCVQPKDLSRREREVLNCLIEDPHIGDKQIAWKLQMSHRTAKFHMSSILHKMGVTGRLQLIDKLNAEGLL